MHSKQVMSPLRELQSLWGLAVSQKLEINQKSLFFSDKIPINEWGHGSCLKYLIKSNSFLFIVIILRLGAYRQYSPNQYHVNHGSALVSVLPHLDLDKCSNTSGQLLITCQCPSSHTVLFIYHYSDWLLTLSHYDEILSDNYGVCDWSWCKTKSFNLKRNTFRINRLMGQILSGFMHFRYKKIIFRLPTV